MKNKIFFAIVLSCSTLVGATAQTTKTPAINQEQREHQAKIQQGVNNGSLTPREERRLQRQQAHIQHDKRLAKADGAVSPQERHHIKKEQRRAERAIRRAKHN